MQDSTDIQELLSKLSAEDLQKFVTAGQEKIDRDIEEKVSKLQKNINIVKSKIGNLQKELEKYNKEMEKITKTNTLVMPIAPIVPTTPICWNTSEKIAKKIPPKHQIVSKKIPTVCNTIPKSFEKLITSPVMPYLDYLKMEINEKKKFATPLIHDKISNTFYISINLGNIVIELPLKKQNTIAPGVHTKQEVNIYEPHHDNMPEYYYRRNDPTAVRNIIEQISISNNYTLAAPFNNNKSSSIVDNIKNSNSFQASFAFDVGAHFMYGMLCIEILKKKGHKFQGHEVCTNYGKI